MNGNTMPIIWLDTEVHNTEDNAELKKKLKDLTQSLTVFDDEEQCEKHIRQLALSEQVIFIVSGSFGSIAIPNLH
ncbi:unnamed protein product, partial [Rotaria sp. Silwood1]